MYKNNKIKREKLDWLLFQNIDIFLELQRNHIEMSKILTNEILESEVEQYQEQDTVTTNQMTAGIADGELTKAISE